MITTQVDLKGGPARGRYVLTRADSEPHPVLRVHQLREGNETFVVESADLGQGYPDPKLVRTWRYARVSRKNYGAGVHGYRFIGEDPVSALHTPPAKPSFAPTFRIHLKERVPQAHFARTARSVNRALFPSPPQRHPL